MSILRSEPDHREGAEGGIWASCLSLFSAEIPMLRIALLSSGSLRKRFTELFAPLEDDTFGVGGGLFGKMVAFLSLYKKIK